MENIKIKTVIYDKLIEQGFSSSLADITSIMSILIVSLIISLIVFWISKKAVKGLFINISRKTKNNFDDILVRRKVPSLLSYLPALFLLHKIIPSIFSSQNWIENIFEALTIVIILSIIRVLLKSINDYLKELKSFKDKPIDSYIQVIMIFLWFIGGIIILSILTGTEIKTFLATLGALSAVLLFVFKDAILGFVASVQITINDTVRIGDWISIPHSNADGTVNNISLSTVQIQNFDNTITSIPTYKLISDSFINWRGMSDSDGRRIKRSILIKVSSIRFLTEKEIEPLKKIDIIAKAILIKESEIKSHNYDLKVNKSILINGRNLTNIGLFRSYIHTYLQNHPMVNTQMTLMCRQLAPTAQGIPIEIYSFISDKNWENYEHIVSDIFDHLLASIHYFHLECFEFSPSPPKPLS